jgi:NADH-quinone oxidoreductase subunit M
MPQIVEATGFDQWLLTLAVFTPAVGALIVMLIPRDSEGSIKLVTLLTTLVTFGWVIAILAKFDYDISGKLQFTADKEWIPVINARYHVALDGISLPLLALSAFITLLCVIYSWNHFPEPHNPKAFLALILILEVGMNGTFVAQDLILFFIFFEIVLLPMFFLIGVWGGPNKEYASIKFFLFTLFGSALMLLSFLALYFKVDVAPDVPGIQHSFDMVALSNAAGAGLVHSTQMLIFAGLFIGFAIKVPMFPFHTWLPDAHTEAPTVGSVLLAAVLLKLGTYGFVRIALPMLPDAAVDWAPWIGLLAIIGMVAHGLITGMLFLVAGSFKHSYGTREMSRLGGLLKSAPKMGWILAFCVMASLGLPGLAGFWGEFPAVLSTFQPGGGLSDPLFRTYMVIAAIGTVLAAGYLLFMLQKVAFGVPKAEFEHAHIHDVSPFEWVAWTPILVLIVVLGIYPNAVFKVTDEPVSCKTVQNIEQPQKGECAEAIADTVAAGHGG